MEPTRQSGISHGLVNAENYEARIDTINYALSNDDGMRLNNAFFRNAPNQYLGLVDAFATGRMEVVRGSAPTLYGADAMGGVLQILTREPTFNAPETHVRPVFPDHPLGTDQKAV